MFGDNPSGASVTYEVHLADNVREKLRKIVKKDSLTQKRLIKLGYL